MNPDPRARSTEDYGSDIDPDVVAGSKAPQLLVAPRERARQTILWVLGGLLVLVVVSWMAGAAFLGPGPAERLNDVADKVFAGVMGAFGLAAGYYFQSLSRQ